MAESLSTEAERASLLIPTCWLSHRTALLENTTAGMPAKSNTTTEQTRAHSQRRTEDLATVFKVMAREFGASQAGSKVEHYFNDQSTVPEGLSNIWNHLFYETQTRLECSPPLVGFLTHCRILRALYNHQATLSDFHGPYDIPPIFVSSIFLYFENDYLLKANRDIHAGIQRTLLRIRVDAILARCETPSESTLSDPKDSSGPGLSSSQTPKELSKNGAHASLDLMPRLQPSNQHSFYLQLSIIRRHQAPTLTKHEGLCCRK